MCLILKNKRYFELGMSASSEWSLKNRDELEKENTLKSNCPWLSQSAYKQDKF